MYGEVPSIHQPPKNGNWQTPAAMPTFPAMKHVFRDHSSGRKCTTLPPQLVISHIGQIWAENSEEGIQTPLYLVSLVEPVSVECD